MFCTNCGLELRDSDRFCSQCGKPTAPGTPGTQYGSKRLALPLEGKKIAGVCAGFARYFEVDVTLVRIIWLAVAVTTGVGFIGYLIAWLLMPKDAPVVSQPATQLAHQNG